MFILICPHITKANSFHFINLKIRVTLFEGVSFYWKLRHVLNMEIQLGLREMSETGKIKSLS